MKILYSALLLLISLGTIKNFFWVITDSYFDKKIKFFEKAKQDASKNPNQIKVVMVFTYLGTFLLIWSLLNFIWK